MSVLNLLTPRLGLYEAWDLFFTLGAIVLAFVLQRFKSGVFQHLDGAFAAFENRCSAIAARPWLSIVIIAVASIGLRLAIAPWLGTPDPVIADEFSLIFQADTMFHGHLANPGTVTPNFEAVYVLLRPTFSSMYPVLRSFPLLVGLLLGVGVWGGVLLSVCALAIAVHWMVRQWVNDRVALLVAAIVILRFGLFSLWVNSYFGSAFTGLGGVLLLGGYRSVMTRSALSGGIAIGVGVLILMTTRPYEALFFAAPILLALAIHFVVATGPVRKALVAPALAAVVFIGLGLGITLASNSAVTHDAKVFPYNLYRQTSSLAPAWLINKPVPIVGPGPRYAIAQHFLDYEYRNYHDNRQRLLSSEAYRFRNYWNFYVGFALTIPFLLGLVALRRNYAVLASIVVLGLALSIETWTFSHYAAPGFGFFMLAIAAGFDAMRKRPAQSGVPWTWLSRTLVLALVVGSVIPLQSTFAGKPDFVPWADNGFSTPCCWLRPRSAPNELRRVVEQTPGRNIVLVDTSVQAPYAILISNEADLENARTLLVNRDPQYDQETIARYPGRRIWTLTWQPGDGAACLTPRKSTDLVPVLPTWVRGSAAACPGGLLRPLTAFQVSSDTMRQGPVDRHK